jgi:hypothetical protein
MKSRANLAFLRDKKAQRSWLALVIVWAIIRALVIGDVFGDYGINGWIYFLVDLGSGIPYAIYSGKAVINFLDKQSRLFRKNCCLALLFFYIPDLYVLIFGKRIPDSLLIGFLISVAIFTAFAILGFRKDINSGQVS